jgi:non-ribosomal peptide synthetase component F
MQNTSREFWHGVLAEGGFTSIPRWTVRPATGTGEYRETLGDDLAAAVRDLAADLDKQAVVDTETAARIAGYHVSALAGLVADPDAEHGRHSLLADDELAYQLDGLAGPTVPLPPYRLHELFERRVALHPDAPAAVHGADWLSYAELNARANRIARALLANGLGREDVVAVACERNLDWMAAVLGILKAGGAYLPIEPHFPADRIATTLGRAGCRLVLTEPESTSTLDPALTTLPETGRLYVSDCWSADLPTHDLGVPVAVAAAWAGVLGTAYDRTGRLDHFFDRGGTSLSAVKLAIALNRAVSLKDITRTPVLADLAAKIDAAA